MIRFACSSCKVALERPEYDAGSKITCPVCQQLLQVPVHAPMPADGIMSALPTSVPAAAPPPQRNDARPVTRTPNAKDAWDDADDVPRRRSRRLDLDADDDFDEIVRPGSRSGRGLEDCTRGATVGFLCSISSLGVIFAAMAVWIVLATDRPGMRRADPFIFVILGLGVASFVLGLVGVIFSSRGLDPINTRSRGLAIAGLICGILGMVVGLIGSLIFFCIGMFLLTLQGR